MAEPPRPPRRPTEAEAQGLPRADAARAPGAARAPEAAPLRWRPYVTVAAVVIDEGAATPAQGQGGPQTLLVEEAWPEGLRWNQPAGHLEAGERLVDAVCREVLEETGCRFTPEAALGAFLLPLPTAAEPDRSYLRCVFLGRVGAPAAGFVPPAPIQRCLWRPVAEVLAAPERWRTPLVGASLQAWAAGVRHPLSFWQDAAFRLGR